MNKKTLEYSIAMTFAFLSIGFIVAAAAMPGFFEWIFQRHHNQLSWYIRPLFLIPFCFFAYKKNLAGISITIFALLTSMFWFRIPEAPSETVKQFLAMEMEYLTGSWGITKIIFTALIPATMTVLAAAIWKRNIKTGLIVVIFMAGAKVLWSLMEGGDSGLSVIVPAVIGLVICTAAIYKGFHFFQIRKRTNDKESPHG